MIPLMIFQAYKQFTDGMSNTKYGMHATVLANIVNVVLNFVLIYGLWIFPRLELVGSGIWHLDFKVCYDDFYDMDSEFTRQVQTLFQMVAILTKLKSNLFGKIINLGFPTAMQMLFEVGVFTAAIWLAGTMGTIDQAANQIALNLSSMTFMIAVGLGVTATLGWVTKKA